MRLIDADEMIKKMNETVTDDEWLLNQFNADFIESFIDEQPTAYDVDKVVEQLREFDGICDSCKHKDECNECSVGERITIVKAGGKE